MDTSELRNRIESWLARFEGQSSQQRDDIHIDELNEAHVESNTWVQGAISCLQTSMQIVRANNLRVVVAIEFFLAASDGAQPFEFESLAELRSGALSWTPPSLTVFREGAEPWRTSSTFVEVDVATGASANDTRTWRVAFSQQWYDKAEDNYDRRLWLVG